MKGWQNFKNICQRVRCDEKLLEQINEFENNPYLVRDQQLEDGFILHKIPYDECISLNDLIDAIKSNYIVIFKGQAILIFKAILQHLIKLAEKKLCHQQLNPNNIFIKLKEESNKFTTYQSIIHIEKIYFVQYLIVSDPENKDTSLTKDVKEIKKIIKQFLEHYKDINLDQLILQVQEVKNINSAAPFKQMNDILDQFIKDQVDVTNQIMKVGELENYNKINKQRHYCEKDLLIYLDEILKIKIQFEPTVIDSEQEEKEQIEQIETPKESEKIQQYTFSHFQPYFVKQFQNYYGDKLQNSYLITGISKKQQIELIKSIDPDRQRANTSFETVQKVIEECFSYSNQVKQEKLQDFKFEITDLSKSAIIDSFYKFYIRHSLDHDLIQEEQYKEVNSKVLQDVKLYIQEHYQMEIEWNILKIINELI